MDDWDLFKAIDIKDISGIIVLRVVAKAQGLKNKLVSSELILFGADYL